MDVYGKAYGCHICKSSSGFLTKWETINLNDVHFYEFALADLIKLAKMVSVMHEADDLYSIQPGDPKLMMRSQFPQKS